MPSAGRDLRSTPPSLRSVPRRNSAPSPRWPIISANSIPAAQLDRVDLIYTEFGGRITTQQLLPIQPPVGEESDRRFHFRSRMPAPSWSACCPAYLRTMLFTAVLSAVAAEHAARVAAMSLATENADELIGKLTLEYNKSRQASHHQRTGRPGRRGGGAAVTDWGLEMESESGTGFNIPNPQSPISNPKSSLKGYASLRGL